MKGKRKRRTQKNMDEGYSRSYKLERTRLITYEKIKREAEERASWRLMVVNRSYELDK